MKPRDFCSAFCTAIALNDVPIGYAFKTPFRKADGDAIALYIRRGPNGVFRIEDDGQTINYLEMNGFDLDATSRSDAFYNLLREYDAFYDDENLLIYSKDMDEKDVPAASVRFSALMLRVFDFILLNKSRVKSTFRDDLIAMIEEQFGQGCQIETNKPLQASMKDYIVDVLVRSADGRTLAVYAGSSELRALESLLFWKEYREQEIKGVKTMLVLETAKPRDIKDRTLARVMNSGILLATLEGDAIAVRQKMSESLLQ